MPHTKNIEEFKKAFSCGSDLVESYCRLIAIELALADVNPKKSHDIINKLQNLSKAFAGQPFAGDLNSRIAELRTAFHSIHVESNRGTATLPLASYPTIRYTRFLDDWPTHTTDQKKINELNKIIKHTMLTLKALGKSV